MVVGTPEPVPPPELPPPDTSVILSEAETIEGVLVLRIDAQFYYGNVDYLEHTIAMGERLRVGFDEASGRHGFTLRQTGPAQMPLVLFDDDAAFFNANTPDDLRQLQAAPRA